MRTYHEYRITLCTCYTVSQFSQPSKKDICIAIYEWRNRDLKDVNQFALPIQLLHGKTEISTQICPVFPPPQCAGFEFNVIALWTSNQINVFKSKKYLFLRSLHNFSRHPNLLSFFIHSCPSSSGSLYLIEWLLFMNDPYLDEYSVGIITILTYTLIFLKGNDVIRSYHLIHLTNSFHAL